MTAHWTPWAAHRSAPATAAPLLSAVAPLLSAVTLLCLGLSAADRVAAQRIPSSYRYLDESQGGGVFGGYMILTTGKWDLGPKSAAYMGGRYAIEVTGPLFAEGLLTYVPTSRDVVDPRRAEGDRTIGEADVHLLMASARLAFSVTGRRTWRRIAPHLFVGVGGVLDAAGAGEADEVLQPEDRFELGATFAASAGAGVRIAAAGRVALRLESSLELWRLNTPTGYGEPSKGLEGVAEREWVRALGFSLGASFRF